MAGRKKLYDTDTLKEIISRYFKEQAIFGQVTARDIAKYASEKLGFIGIDYYHFTRNKEIKEYISEINAAYLKCEGSNIHTVVDFNPDKVLAVYGNDDTMLKRILWQFANRHRTLNDDILKLKAEKINIEKYVEKLESEKNRLKERLKEQDAIIAKKTNEVKNLKKFKKFIDKTYMLEYLKSHNLFNKLDEHNINLILNSLGCTDEAVVDCVEEDLIGHIDENEIDINIDGSNITTIKYKEIERKLFKIGNKKKETGNVTENKENIKSEVDKAIEDMESWL